MFVVEVGALLTTIAVVRDLVAAQPAARRCGSPALVTLWLWFTVLFANFAEAVAEGRGKAQAASLRKMRKETEARRLVDGREETVSASTLRKGDTVVVRGRAAHPRRRRDRRGHRLGGRVAPSPASPPRSSARAAATGRAVTGGTKVLSDRIVVRITANPGESFLDRMIALVEGAARQKTPNEIALHILLVGLTARLPASPA